MFTDLHIPCTEQFIGYRTVCR